MEKRNAKALLPIAVFVVLYLGLGILFEYGLNIEMGFYKIPVVIIFLLALLVACLQNRKLSLNDKLKIMGVGISDPNIYHDHHIYAGWNFCGCCWKNISKQCGIFYSVTDTASVCGCGAFCSKLFCITCNGDFRRNHYFNYPDWNSRVASIGV